MTNYLSGYGTTRTPQNQPIPGSKQVANSAGGYAWELDRFDRLRRFLILGTEGGTYYISERKLTTDAVANLISCIQEDGQRVVDMIREVSTGNLSPKPNAAIFALAAVSKIGNDEVKRAARNILPEVCRTATHLFTFVGYVNDSFGGLGRGSRRAIGDWYNEKTTDKLAYQLVKYRNREGWTHKDVLKVSHPKPVSPAHNDIYNYVVRDSEETGPLPEIITGFEKIQNVTNAKDAAQLIADYNLPRECVPTEFLKSPEVWEALLLSNNGMPVMAMVRNLGNMSKVGLITPMSSANDHVLGVLNDSERIHNSRIHPFHILLALDTYASGHGYRGSGSWTVSQDIVDALESAFYLAFHNVQPANKRTLIALDISTSMLGHTIANSNLSAGVGATAMAMITAKTEPKNHIFGFAHDFRELDFSGKSRLREVTQRIYSIGYGGTDCSLPMLYAKERNIPVDTFVIYTDNETWAGRYAHPSQALVEYRRATGINSKLVVVGMATNDFTIADPNDKGMLDVVGFDASAPALISNFSGGAW